MVRSSVIVILCRFRGARILVRPIINDGYCSVGDRRHTVCQLLSRSAIASAHVPDVDVSVLSNRLGGFPRDVWADFLRNPDAYWVVDALGRT